MTYAMEKTSENTFRVRVAPDGRRFQITVYDFRDSSLTPEGEEDRCTFILETLPAYTHPSTAYSSGDMLYNGYDPEAVASALRRYFGEGAIDWHEQFERYLNDPKIPTHTPDE